MIKALSKPIKYFASGNFALRFGKWNHRFISKIPFGRYFMRQRYAPPAPHLEREVFGMRFSSPIGLAAGYDTNGTLIDSMDAMGFGFIEIGAITPKPQIKSDNKENALYRMTGDSALLNYSEVESLGVEQVIENIKNRSSKIIVGCNILKNSKTARENAPIDYLRLFRPLYQYVDFFTVNLCDNSSDATYVPADKDEVMAILTPLFEFRRGQNQYRPILIKISPDLTDEQIDTMTDIMLDTPLDGIVAVSGTTGRYGLENSKNIMHTLGRIPGALCGTPLKNRAIEVVRRIHERSKGTYPIIGCGGVSTADDAFEMLQAGATLVEIYSSFFYGGGKMLRNMRTGLNERLRKQVINEAAKSEANESASHKAANIDVTSLEANENIKTDNND